MLLEEAILYLLRKSGYSVLFSIDPKDETLTPHSAGIAVVGRGAEHQIDAIADYKYQAPFTHPQRLLLEAKAYTPPNSVGLPILRSTLGVAVDVQQFWKTCGLPHTPSSRYHYQHAIVSTSGFSPEAERFGFAHDIYMIPVGNSGFLRDLVNEMFAVTHEAMGMDPNIREPGRIQNARKFVRSELYPGETAFNGGLVESRTRAYKTALDKFLTETKRLDTGLLAMLPGNVPIFLVPNSNPRIREMALQSQEVRIYYNLDDDLGGKILNARDEELFTFDLPTEIVKMLLAESTDTGGDAPQTKKERLHRISIFYVDQDSNSLRTIELSLDKDWLKSIEHREE